MPLKRAARPEPPERPAPPEPKGRFRALIARDPAFWRLVPTLVALRLALYVMSFVQFRMIHGGGGTGWDTFVSLWTRWDVEHYVQIAEHGYVSVGPDAKNIAFFPMFPALVGVTHALLPFLPTTIVGMLWSNGASLAGLLFLHRLARERWDETVADRAVLYASTFPTAYFFLAAYTEALFFLFVVAGFFYLSKEKWLEAALYAAFASATRVTGALVGLAWGIHYLRTHRFRLRRDVWPVVIVPLGVVGYLALNQVLWHDALKFLEFQRTAWYHESTTPWHGFEVTLDYVFAVHDLRAWWYRDIPELIAAVVGFASAALTFWQIGVLEGIYVLGSVILWTSNTWWMSGPRFCLVLFPIYFLVGARRWPRWAHQALWAVGIVMQMAYVTCFTTGNWAF